MRPCVMAAWIATTYLSACGGDAVHVAAAGGKGLFADVPSLHRMKIEVPCSSWWVTEQNAYTTFPDLKRVGLGVGAVSINDDYFAAGGAWKFEAFMSASEDQVYQGISEYATRYPRGGRNTTDLIVIDLESPVNPGNLSGYNASELARVVKAMRLRVCLTRQIFPRASLGIYGTAIGVWLPGSEQGLLDAANLGLFDDIDYLIPVLYLGKGMNAAAHTETVMRASAKVTDSQGNFIPMAPMLSWIYFGATDNDCAVSQADTTAVVQTIEKLKTEWYPSRNITVPIVQLWSGSDSETSACADKESQHKWLETTKIVPTNCIPSVDPSESSVTAWDLLPQQVRGPKEAVSPAKNFSNDTCLQYTQAGFIVESVSPTRVPNTGGAVVWITGKHFDASSTAARCKFFMNRAGFTWGEAADQSYDPFPEHLAHTPNPVSNATVVNSTHMHCTVPEISIPIGDANTSKELVSTIRVGGPITMDVSLNGIDYSGYSPVSPSNLWLFPPLSVSFGRNPYVATNHGNVLFKTDAASLCQPDDKLVLTVKCGSTVLLNAVPVGLQTAGAVPVHFAALPSSGTITCEAKLATSSGSGTTTITSELMRLVRVADASPVQTVIDYETRSIRVDDGPFLPFGFFTHEAGLASREDQMYLASLGINNFMHYMFEGYDTPIAVADYMVLSDDVTQLGAWIQPDFAPLANEKQPIYPNVTINMTRDLSAAVSALKEMPGIWAWYDSDDTIGTNITNDHYVRDLIRKTDPHHVISKAQASTSSAYAFAFLADMQMAEMYCERSPTCTSSVQAETVYPMDWTPNGICGDAGFEMGVGYAGPGTWPQALRTQWFTALTKGAVANSLFIFLSYMPYLQVETLAEAALATFELAPSLHTSGTLAEKPQISVDDENVMSAVWREPNGCVLVLAVNGADAPSVGVRVNLTLSKKPILGTLVGFKPLNGLLPVNLSEGSFTLDLQPYESDAYIFNCSASRPEAFQDPENMVLNPSMEEFYLPGFATGWQLFGGNTLTSSSNVSAYVFSETRFAHDGRHSLRISVPWDSCNGSRVRIPGFHAEKGVQYDISAWGRVYVASMCSPLLVVDSGDNVVGQPLKLSQGKWSQLTTSGTVATHGPLSFTCGSGGTFYLDDVQVKSKGHSTVVDGRVESATDATSRRGLVHDLHAAPGSAHLHMGQHPPTAAHQHFAASARSSVANGTITVDSSPFIPMGWFATDVVQHGTNHTEYHLARLSSRGVNTVFLAEVGPESAIGMQQQVHALNVSWAAGLMVVVQISSESSALSLANYINQVKWHPAIFGYLIGNSTSLPASSQQQLYETLKQHDPERLVLSLQPDPSTAAAMLEHLDVLLIPADTVGLSEAQLLRSKPTIAVGGNLKVQDSIEKPGLFHHYSATSSRLRHSVYNALLSGCAGYMMAWFTPGTPYSLVNGVGEMALEVAELLPSFTSSLPGPDVKIAGVDADQAPLVARGYKEASGAVHVILLNNNATAVHNVSLVVDGVAPGSSVYTPFSMNRSYTVATSGGGGLSLFAQPWQVQVFRYYYPWSFLQPEAGNVVRDPLYEDYELFPGFSKHWFINIFTPIGFVDGRMSTALGETRPGFVRPGRRHSLRMTRPYVSPAKPARRGEDGAACSMLVPFEGKVYPGTTTISFWHRTAPGAEALGLNTSVTLNGLGAKGSFLSTPTWTQEKWSFTCGVNGTGGAKPVRCSASLSLALTWGGQLWLDEIVVSNATRHAV